jgi:hypothetical protein
LFFFDQVFLGVALFFFDRFEAIVGLGFYFFWEASVKGKRFVRPLKDILVQLKIKTLN